MRFKKISAYLFFAVIFLLSFFGVAQAGSQQETLSQYISDLQKNPADNALREKIIKLVLTANPKPTTPQEAVTHEGAAEFAIRHAKTSADFADAAKEYEQALLAAPWLAADYFNCAVAYEKSEQYSAAVKNFNFYLIAAPGAKDTNDVLKRIGGLEYAAKKSAKESVSAAPEQKQSEDWLAKLDGRRYICAYDGGTSGVIDIKGNVFVVGSLVGQSDYQETNRFEIHGRESAYPMPKPQTNIAPAWAVETTFIISEDGARITMRVKFNDGDMRDYVYLWK